MTSPDLRQYVDLTIYDKDTQDVYEMSVAVVKAAMPEWNPEEGNTEVVLIEAMAQEVMETVYAINRLPGAVMQTLLQLYGVTRSEGEQPIVTLRVFLSDSLGHEIPAGTRFMLTLGEGIEPVIFSTDVAVVVPNGFNFTDIAATGDRFTDEANGTIVGELVELLDAIPYVNYAQTQTLVSDGVPEETDQEWLDRGVARMSRLVDTLTIPAHFTSASLEDSNVTRAKTLDNYDPTTDVDGNGPVGNDPGHVTIAVYGYSSNLSTGDKNTLEANLEAKALANLEIHVIDPTINTQDVTAVIQPADGYTDAEAIANATDAINALLSPETWDWSTTLYRNDIIAAIGSATGVARVTTLTTPAADVVLTGVAPLVIPDDINITVV